MRFTPRTTFVAGALDFAGALARIAGLRGVCALDSAGGAPARWSWIGFEPLRGPRVPSSIEGLRALLGPLERGGGDPIPGPFAGGFLGALSYDLGVAGEASLALPRDPWRTPAIVGGLYTDFLVFDHARGELVLVLGLDPGDGRPALAERRDHVLARLWDPAPRVTPCRARGPLLRDVTPEIHGARIERCRERIAAGDLYQANLAHRTTVPVEGDPLDLYLRLRAVNPAPYAGYLAWEAEQASDPAGFPRGALLSASPELLLEHDGERARTRPIKGTAPRGGTPEEDRERARSLEESAKDRAELAMIVDLERNDLGRVAEAGSVAVERFAHLESYASVHHLTADVVARPRAGLDAVDLVAALFPGGSITGAPKLASMRVIAELEGAGRGFFSGSLGFLSLDGRACFDILIRTLVWRPRGADGASPARGEVSFHVGGGITWSSVAEAEERETQHKAAALAAALGA